MAPPDLWNRRPVGRRPGQSGLGLMAPRACRARRSTIRRWRIGGLPSAVLNDEQTFQAYRSREQLKSSGY
jgi:hypothetical protein